MFIIAFEEICGGLTEHSLPVIKECLRQNHKVLIGTFPAEIDAVKNALKEFEKAVTLTSFDDFDSFKSIDAIYSSVPNCPGPWMKSSKISANVPRIAATHGLTDKATKFPAEDPTDPLAYFNVVFATGPSMFDGSWQAYKKQYPQTIEALNIFNIGSPKTDELLNVKIDKEKLLRSLDLDPDKKTVLYSPTYQKEASLEQNGLDIIQALCSLDINVLVRLHHCSIDLTNEHAAQFGHEGKDWRKLLESLEKKHSNFRHVFGDSNPYFKTADLLIGDVSGACYEYLLTEKPIIFYDVPKFFEVHGQKGIAYWGRSAGEIVSDSNELIEKANLLLDNPQNGLQQRQDLIKQLVYNPGQGAQKALTTIKELISKPDLINSTQVKQKLNEEHAKYNSPLKKVLTLKGKRIALYGAGQFTRILLRKLEDENLIDSLSISCILDDYPKENESHINGIAIKKPSDLNIQEIDFIVLSTDKFQKQMTQNCHDIFGYSIKLINLYD